MTADVVSLEEFWPGFLVFCGMLVSAVVIAFGFGIALCRGVLTEHRRAPAVVDEPPSSA